jgi:hypothetical protein
MNKIFFCISLPFMLNDIAKVDGRGAITRSRKLRNAF